MAPGPKDGKNAVAYPVNGSYRIQEGPGSFGFSEFKITVHAAMSISPALREAPHIYYKKILKAEFLKLCSDYFEDSFANRELIDREKEAYKALCSSRNAKGNNSGPRV